ncbi:MAG: hypothetical protein IJO33_03395 [Bacilli bacterium]|nr:hypothetical protein [Bacilli bacterium]
MKEAIGGNWLFMIVIFFVILFAGYMCLSINQTKAFNVKNSLIRILERNGSGMSSVADLADDINFIDEVTAELAEVGYRINGDCTRFEEEYGPGWTGFDEQGNLSDTNSAFCVRRVETASALGAPRYYYQVITFYHLEIPLVRTIFNLSIKGDTKPMI